MLICDTLNLVGVTAYDRKKLAKEHEIAVRNRLLLGQQEKPPVYDANAVKSYGGTSVPE